MEQTSNFKTPGTAVRVVAAILLTIGGFLSLVAGDFFFSDSTQALHGEIRIYIIPVIYLTLVHYFLKKYHFLNEILFQKRAIPLRGLKTFSLGVLAMIIPLGLSLLGQVLPCLGKKPAAGYPTILFQLILLNLLIGFFEEGLFRYTIFRLLVKAHSKKSLVFGFLLSSLLFGFLHFGNLTTATQKPIAVSSQVIYACFLGMLFAALYLQFQSFPVIAVLHGFVDFLTYFPMLYGQTEAAASPDITFTQGLLTVALLLPSGLCGILLLIRFIRIYFARPF